MTSKRAITIQIQPGLKGYSVRLPYSLILLNANEYRRESLEKLLDHSKSTLKLYLTDMPAIEDVERWGMSVS